MEYKTSQVPRLNTTALRKPSMSSFGSFLYRTSHKLFNEIEFLSENPRLNRTSQRSFSIKDKTSPNLFFRIKYLSGDLGDLLRHKSFRTSNYCNIFHVYLTKMGERLNNMQLCLLQCTFVCVCVCMCMHSRMC